ncbi:uncharacterized protein LOC118439378 [Folsomia candida]|uniref:Uncharacterized protein n=1 Tax=Folsomia candida TaxID=158441 RepID=A0A226D4B3_FOLCA|nr:uncharacterized protein LOC118439378 [Folsomia candida]OXA40405.1 hypothetical protein Fcan01_24924 [Folsomia candida]
MENIDEEHHAMRAALQNPIILEKILQNGSVHGKTARLVSHFWNKIILLSMPHPKLTLRLDPWGNHACNPIPFQQFCLTMEPRLARSITHLDLTGECDDHSAAQHLSSAESKLLQISGQFGHFIEDLWVDCDHADFIPTTLYKIVQNCLPNLKRLRVNFVESLENADEESNINVDFYPCTLHKLISLRIEDVTNHPGALKMTQWLLNSAPNLTYYFSDGNQLPDFGRNGSLKRVELNVSLIEVSDLQSANFLRKLNKILDQVKDTVELFYLRVGRELPYQFETGIGPRDLHIPRMKKLKEFENSALNLFSCGDKLQNIGTARMPNLQSLWLSACTSDTTLCDLLRNVMKEKDLFKEVENLHVENLHPVEVIAGLKTPFPKLENFSIYHDDMYSCLFSKVQSYLEAFAALGLKYLEIKVLVYVNKDNFSRFIQGFSNFGKLLSSLRGFKIRFNEKRNDFSEDLDLIEDRMAQMKQWLLQMKGVDDVYISGIRFTRETWEWMEIFIQENKIPIVFKEK